MRIEFHVSGVPVIFARNWFTGATTLQTLEGTARLQSALRPQTHISMALTKTWTQRVHGHEVVVEMGRHLMFGGFRPMRYRVIVDGEAVACQVGY